MCQVMTLGRIFNFHTKVEIKNCQTRYAQVTHILFEFLLLFLQLYNKTAY